MLTIVGSTRYTVTIMLSLLSLTLYRMRFMIGVLRVRNAPAVFLRRVLEANFHSALDAKYAVFGDVLWSTFMHPLSSLSVEDATAGIDQVCSTSMPDVTSIITTTTTTIDGMTALELYASCIDSHHFFRTPRVRATSNGGAWGRWCDWLRPLEPAFHRPIWYSLGMQTTRWPRVEVGLPPRRPLNV